MHIEHFAYEKGHQTPWHAHPSGQLYWLKSGIMNIEMADVQWTVTAGSLGWFPGGHRHCAQAPGAAKGASLYLHQTSSALFPELPGIFSADNFVQGLLERASLCPESDYQQCLLTVLAAEMNSLAPLPLGLPLPVDRRARNVADALLAQPDCVLDQVALAHRWGVSVRTLSRLFRQQTGLSFSQWRQQARIVSSLEWVLAGLPISEIAARSGYSTVSAYIEVFRGRFGVTPGQFRDNR